MSTALLRALRTVVSASNVRDGVPERIAYSADMWPRQHIWKLAGDIERFPPDAVVWAQDEAEVAAIHAVCVQHGAPIIPYGAGSGVCGGTLPVRGGVVLDTKRMNRIGAVDDIDLTVAVEPGVIGMHLEEVLADRGYTLGHFPSSILCSTVGGWVAARSAGQYSSKYGKIEDMIVSLRCVLADGSTLQTGPEEDFDWTQAIVGSEGTLGTITGCVLRVHPAPAARAFRGFRFRTLDAGMRAIRLVMQAGLSPNLLRLYDPFDSLLHAGDGSSGGGLSSMLSPVRELLSGRVSARRKQGARQVGIAMALSQPRLLNRLIDRISASCLLVLGFEGGPEAVDEDMRRASQLLLDAGGTDGGEGPGRRWLEHRYDVSFKQAAMFEAGAFVDTMEVAATWARLPDLYRAVRRAVSGHVMIMAHFSHAYREGCSIYFTFAAYKRDPAALERLHERVWEEAQTAVIRAGGTISHHHGVGYSKRGHMAREHGAGIRLLYGLKDTLDADERMNPGKVLPDRAANR